MSRLALEEFPLSGLVKGMPNGVAPFPLGEIGRKGWNLLREDLPLPAAVLRLSALEHNERWMAAFLGQAGAMMAPHGKTSMSPQLFARQMASGAWAITVANAQQLEVAREAGFTRIVVANQLVGRQALRYVAELLARDGEIELYCLVDSTEGAALLAEALGGEALKRPLN